MFDWIFPSARWCPVDEEFQESKILWFFGDGGRGGLGSFGFSDILGSWCLLWEEHGDGKCVFAILEVGVTLGVDAVNHG